MTKDELIVRILDQKKEANPWFRLRMSHYYLLQYVADQEINDAVNSLNEDI